MIKSQKKRILVVCFPTWGRENVLHLNSTEKFIVLAPDEMIRILEEMDVQVDVANLSRDTADKPLMRSHKMMVNFEKDSIPAYDLIWHMFRDPTQPEVLELLNEEKTDYHGKQVINNANRLRDHDKWHYLPILEKHGIGPRVLPNYNYANTKQADWSEPMYGASVAIIDGAPIVRTAAFNNNRGDYQDRSSQENIFVEYIDNAASGVRSFFRAGYSMGSITSGWMYCSEDKILTQKSGSCKHQVPFQIPSDYHEPIERCMRECGIDVCHFEGLFVKDRLYLFDINPYPTANGNTLGTITGEICKRIVSHLNEE